MGTNFIKYYKKYSIYILNEQFMFVYNVITVKYSFEKKNFPQNSENQFPTEKNGAIKF